MAKVYCHSYRLFLEFNLFPHTTSQEGQLVKLEERYTTHILQKTVVGTSKNTLNLANPCFGEKSITF